MKRKGFTLIELSIVLIIIGLIVAGVLAGQSLVESAKIRQVISNVNEIKSAVRTFELKYNALPGDMNNATSYWGAAGGCYADTTGTTNTCNGDGSRKLAYVSTIADTSNVEYEPWHFWKHLANAGLIPADVSGYSDNTKCSTANSCLQPGINSIAGPFTNSGWFAFSVATSADKVWQGRGTNQNRNIIAFVNPSNASGNRWHGASLTPSGQYSIDIKLDDGMPYTGKIVDISGTSASYTNNCATANSDDHSTDNATYKFTEKTEVCALLVDLE